MSAEKHYVYAVIRTDAGEPIKSKVSDALSWDAAQDRWKQLDDIRFARDLIEVRGTPVDFFAVRSADDPDWPRRGRERYVLISDNASSTGFAVI